MHSNISTTPLFQKIKCQFETFYSDVFGKLSAIHQISATYQSIAVTGPVYTELNGPPKLQLFLFQYDVHSTDDNTPKPVSLSSTPANYIDPVWSNSGESLFYLSDIHNPGQFNLYQSSVGLLDATLLYKPPGHAEYLTISTTGNLLLVGIAGAEADKAGILGGTKQSESKPQVESWQPSIIEQAKGNQRRHVCIYQLTSGTITDVGFDDHTIWNACFRNDESLIALVSPDFEEGAWYNAKLVIVQIEEPSISELYQPKFQIGLFKSNQIGNILALIEGPASDRGLVAGKLLLIELDSKRTQTTVAVDFDVCHFTWITDNELVLCGIQGNQTIIAQYDVTTDAIVTLCASTEWTLSGLYPSVCFNGRSELIVSKESFHQPPKIQCIQLSQEPSFATLYDLNNDGFNSLTGALKPLQSFTWQAPDGLEIDGWLALPNDNSACYPLVVEVHGGPVWAYRNQWMGRSRTDLLLLISRGFAIFFPNPRGSSGKGCNFMSAVFADVGGEDCLDITSGVEKLIELGVTEKGKIAIAGGSYGGFMAGFLPSRSELFSAAILVSPVTDWYSQHGTANIPEFDSLYVSNNDPVNTHLYHERSPVFRADKNKTPSLIIAGKEDRYTPPINGAAMYNALKEQGIDTHLALYSGEGHGVKSFPAFIDYSTRVVAWLSKYILKQDVLMK